MTPARTPIKHIPIDQLLPEMMIVGIDLPWYRTPFLSHARLIADAATIEKMRRCGVRIVTIDTSLGKDVPEEAVFETVPGVPAASASPPMTDGAATPAREPSASVEALYADSQRAMERIFADLEQGVPPPPAATKTLVTKILTQVLQDQAGLLTHLVVQKLKQFDRSLAAHALDTCILSLIVAVQNGLDEAMLADLGAGALLHDAGYMRLPRNLVRRRGEGSQPERLLLEQHPQLGLALLAEQVDCPESVRRIVAEHHERADGSGFPAGLQGTAVSHLAHLVGILDTYDNLMSRRGGRPALLPHDAIRQLFLSGERGLFHKPLVESVIRSLGVYPIGTLVRLNTGEQAVVVEVNPVQRLKPLVKITGGPQGESYADPLPVDLAAQPHEQGVRTVLRVLDPAQERVNIAMYLDGPPSRVA